MFVIVVVCFLAVSQQGSTESAQIPGAWRDLDLNITRGSLPLVAHCEGSEVVLLGTEDRYRAKKMMVGRSEDEVWSEEEVRLQRRKSFLPRGKAGQYVFKTAHADYL